MKLPTSLIPIFVLASLTHACGSIPDDPMPAKQASVASSPAVQSNELFADSRNHTESELLAAAAHLLRTGRYLSAQLAAGCLTREKERARVREACMLAWSGSPSEMRSPEDEQLEGQLKKLAATGRPYAIALIRRPSLLGLLRMNEFLILLERISTDPSWLRAGAISAWLERNPVATERERLWLWNAANFDEKTMDPASAASAVRLAQQIDPGRETEVYSLFCPPAGPALVKVRCLRFLSSLVDPATLRVQDSETLRRYLRAQTEGWPLFSLEFPERALLLSPFRP